MWSLQAFPPLDRRDGTVQLCAEWWIGIGDKGQLGQLSLVPWLRKELPRARSPSFRLRSADPYGPFGLICLITWSMHHLASRCTSGPINLEPAVSDCNRLVAINHASCLVPAASLTSPHIIPSGSHAALMVPSFRIIVSYGLTIITRAVAWYLAGLITGQMIKMSCGTSGYGRVLIVDHGTLSLCLRRCARGHGRAGSRMKAEVPRRPEKLWVTNRNSAFPKCFRNHV